MKHRLVFLASLEALIDVYYHLSKLYVLWLVHDNFGFERLQGELLERFWIGTFETWEAARYFLVRSPCFVVAVCIRAVLAIVAILALRIVLAHLCFVVVIGDIHHLKFNFDRKLFVSPA